MDSLIRRAFVKTAIVAKILLDKLGVPGRGDVLFRSVWDWRYPTYLYLSLPEDLVVECEQGHLPFFVGLVSWRDFFFRIRAWNGRMRPMAKTVLSAEEEHLKDPGSVHWRISYDYYGENSGPGTVCMPYFAHPEFYRRRLHERASRERGRNRNIRLLFAGTWEDEKYEKGFHFPILGRSAILRAVHQEFRETMLLVEERTQLPGRNDGPAEPIVFIVSRNTDDTTSRHILQLDEYVSFLARSDFFLAPPGLVMPHCHNVIEAMSVGTIPVLNYGAWFDPPLTDGLNCVMFETEEDLKRQISRVLALHPDQIAAMRREVIHYFDTYLRPEAFREVLRTHLGRSLTIRVNAEYRQ